jgi:Protein of unknwon function (DUF3008)
MGMAWAYSKGDLKIDDLPESMKDKVKEIANSMKKEDLSDYAHTERKNLPERVTSIVDEILKLSVMKDFIEQDDEIRGIIKKLPKLTQRQYSTKFQLQLLYEVANKLGLYDAADVLKK